ncbi:MAG: hypothetical protein NT023_10185 [Armatimonadetes bacterium]|nr:hypothetical protein [Armatimonadota bacterium]
MKTVLFIDDRTSVIEPLKEALEDDGFAALTAITAQEGQETLRKCIEEGKPVTLVVLDVGFPAMSIQEMLRHENGAVAVRNAPAADLWQGATLYPQLRKEFPELKIIIYSVRGEEEVRTLFPNTDFDCTFLRKGKDDPLEIYRTIKQHLK